MTFPIQILSDLHLEFERLGEAPYTYDFPARAPTLALLGDIGLVRDERLFTWLSTQLRRFERVFYVSGNHEPYGISLDDAEIGLKAFETVIADLRETDTSLGEFIFLNRDRRDILVQETESNTTDGVPRTRTISILGCTLWSELDPEHIHILSWALNDFHKIVDFEVPDYQAAHANDVQWLENTVEDIRREAEADPEGNERTIVILTHHVPTVEGTSDPKFIGSPSNSAFATEITTRPWWRGAGSSDRARIALWAFGHTHWCSDFERSGARFVSNQRGYKGGEVGFEGTKVVMV